MIFVKKSAFSPIFFWSKKSQKEKFFDVLDSKKCFLDLKSEVLKNSKKSKFCKGVSPWCSSKNRPFSCMFFLAKKARKKHFLIFWKVKNTFRPEKWNSSKVKKIDVSPWFLTKIRPSSYMFLLSKQSKKKTFFDILDSKEYFLDLQSETLAKSKKSTFCKGVSPWFFSKKSTFFLYVFLSKKSQKETFFHILDRK